MTLIARIRSAFWRWWHANIVADAEKSAVYDRIDRELRRHGQ